MSGKATGWVLVNFPIHTVSDRNRKLVLVSIADAANQHGRGACAAVDVICAEWGFSKPTVSSHIKALLADGWLELETPSRGRGGPSVYSIPRMIRQSCFAQSADAIRQSSSAESSDAIRQSAAFTQSSAIRQSSDAQTLPNSDEHTSISNYGTYGKHSPRLSLGGDEIYDAELVTPQSEARLVAVGLWERCKRENVRPPSLRKKGNAFVAAVAIYERLLTPPNEWAVAEVAEAAWLANLEHPLSGFFVEAALKRGKRTKRLDGNDVARLHYERWEREAQEKEHS